VKPLWNHQVLAIRVAEKLRDLGLLFDMGTGKTRTLIEILRRRYAAAGRVQRTLILAPVVVCPNWKKEFGMYSKINPNDILVLTGSQKRRVAQLLQAVGETLAKNKIIVTNYEAMEMKDLYQLFIAYGFEVLVSDESQRLKNHESVRAKAVAQIADKTQHNYILTGTPILNSAMDLYMQFRILDRGETFGKNFYSFRNKYFEDENAGMNKKVHFPKWGPRPFTYDDLQARVKAKAMRVTKDECMDLPPFMRLQAEVELSPAQSKAYKEMLHEYITFIQSKKDEPRAVVAQLAVTKALRLQQIVSGFVKDETGDVHRLPCPRLTVLEQLLTDIVPGNKVIVWATFKENYKMIAELCDKLEYTYAQIHGDISHKDRQEQMEEFRTNPNVRVMIANQGAGGVGINLIEASYSIYYSKGFKLEDDLQSEARNYRGGSEMHSKITRIDLVAKGTIDELVTEALALKQDIGQKILGWEDRL